MNRNWISSAAALLACIALVSTKQNAVNNKQQLLPPLQHAYEVRLFMKEYSNPRNKDVHGSTCDLYVLFSDSYKCDVMIWLTLTNMETGEKSQVLYPDKNLFGDYYYSNTDRIDTLFKTTGSYAALQVNQTFGKNFLVEARIVDSDDDHDDLIAEVAIVVPIEELLSAFQTGIYQPRIILDNSHGVAVTVTVGLTCADHTCCYPYCILPDKWRVWDQGQLTCSHLPFLDECVNLAGNFRYGFKVHKIKLMQIGDCIQGIQLCITGLTDLCQPRDFAWLNSSWPTDYSSMNSKTFAQLKLNTEHYQRVVNRIQRKVKLQFHVHRRCGDGVANTTKMYYDPDISTTLGRTKKQLELTLDFRVYVKLVGTLVVTCADTFTGVDCQKRINRKLNRKKYAQRLGN